MIPGILIVIQYGRSKLPLRITISGSLGNLIQSPCTSCGSVTQYEGRVRKQTASELDGVKNNLCDQTLVVHRRPEQHEGTRLDTSHQWSSDMPAVSLYRSFVSGPLLRRQYL